MLLSDLATASQIYGAPKAALRKLARLTASVHIQALSLQQVAPYCEFWTSPPEPADPLELEKALNATFSKMYGDAHRDVKPGEHPGMHRTESVDYALMLEGELVAILDKEETVLRAGDVLIQRGTTHAWANRSGKPARIAFVLVSGKY